MGQLHSTLPIPGLAEHAIGFKTLGEAIYLHNHVLSRLDAAASTIDPALRERYPAARLTDPIVPGVKAGQIYAWRVDGPADAPPALRFDPARVLLDPYGRGVVIPSAYDRDAWNDLASAYRTSLQLAVKNGLRTIAFPAISTGLYAYPRDQAADDAGERALHARDDHHAIRPLQVRQHPSETVEAGHAHVFVHDHPCPHELRADARPGCKSAFEQRGHGGPAGDASEEARQIGSREADRHLVHAVAIPIAERRGLAVAVRPRAAEHGADLARDPVPLEAPATPENILGAICKLKS